MQWTYGYDAADQLIRAIKATTGPTPTVVASYGYRYDTAGNRTAEQIGDVVTGATHDAANRLLTHTAAGALRVAGHPNEPARVTIDGQPATLEGASGFVATKQLASGTNTFTVAATDMAGNTATKTYEVTAAGATRTFTSMRTATRHPTARGRSRGAEDRLLAVVDGAHRSEFTYDGESRRVRIVEKESGTTVRDAQLFWAGTAIIEERLSTGAVNRFFGAAEQHNGVARYVTRDHLGSVREVTDIAGVVVTRNDYDPYGRLTRVAGTEDSRFGFTGHYAHTPTGLALTLYRAYEPHTGRWLSVDPIREAGGANLYAYVSANPLNRVDPLGLEGFVSAAVQELNPFNSLGSIGQSIRSVSDSLGGMVAWGGGLLTGDAGLRHAASRQIAQAYWGGPLGQTACGPTWAWAATRGALGVSGAAAAALAVAMMFSGGANTVLWDGFAKGGLHAAIAGKGRGILISETIGGRSLMLLESAMQRDLPRIVWAMASAIFAGNAKGVVQVFSRAGANAGTILQTVELKVIQTLGNAQILHK